LKEQLQEQLGKKKDLNLRAFNVLYKFYIISIFEGYESTGDRFRGKRTRPGMEVEKIAEGFQNILRSG